MFCTHFGKDSCCITYTYKLSSESSWEDDDRYCGFYTQLILWKPRLRNWDLSIIMHRVYNKLKRICFVLLAHILFEQEDKFYNNSRCK